MSQPFVPGERALLIDEKGRTFLITLKDAGQFHHHGGAVPHELILGQPEGVVVVSGKGVRLSCFRPRFADYSLKMPRGAQVVYPKDIALILMYTDVRPGSRVLEAGTGSGALCMALCEAAGSTGSVITYEMRDEFKKKAAENISAYFGRIPDWLQMRDGRLQEVHGETFDRVVLDMPEPWQTLETLDTALESGGIVCGYVPTTGQVQSFTLALEERGYAQIHTVEAMVRSWHVTSRSVRPDHRMVAHTGFITTARKTTASPSLPPVSDEE